MDIFLLLILIMILLVIFQLSEDGIGEELTVINLIITFIQEEKQEIKFSTKIVMEYLVFQAKVFLTKICSARNQKDSVLQ